MKKWETVLDGQVYGFVDGKVGGLEKKSRDGHEKGLSSLLDEISSPTCSN